MKRTGIFALVVVVGMLTGCTSAAPEPTSVPTPSATPSATPVAEPGARVPLTCEELVPETVRVPVLGGGSIREVPDFVSLSTDVGPETAGVRVCNWTNPAPDVFARFHLTVTADPQDIAAFQPVRTESAPWEVHDLSSVGDDATVGCGQYESGSVSCGFSVLAGPYWFGGYANVAAPDVAAAEAVIADLTTAIVVRLATAPPKAEWTPTQRATVDSYDCGWMDTDGAVAATIDAAGNKAEGPSGTPDDTLERIYTARVGASWCSIWGAANAFAIYYVPGSGWAWESAATGWTPTTVAGASDAVADCRRRTDREYFDCSVRALVGDTIVEGESSGSVESETLAQTLVTLAAAIPYLPLETVSAGS